MPSAKPFPSREADLSIYFQTAVPHLIANSARLGVSPANVTSMTTELSNWNSDYPASQNLNTRTMTIVQTKDATRQRFMNLLRAVYADIPESSWQLVDRNTLNVPAKKTTRSAVPAPSTKPIGQVSTNHRLEHTISFTDENGHAAKPNGVRGSQIWYKIGAAPIDPKELLYMATDTASPYTHVFDGEHAGEPVHYWLRWENTRGKTGPWSDAVTATITG